MASGITTALGTLLSIHSANIAAGSDILMKNAELFVPGMLWFGPFVFFISLLITSSSAYSKGPQYTNNNLITVICAVSAVLVGNLYDIPQLSGISGTVFFIFLLEKYCEFMPNRVEVWAWTTLILGIMLYLANVHYRMEFEKYGLHEYFHFTPPVYNLVLQ